MPTPSKFTRERIEEIMRARRLGASGITCARAGGISEATLREWLKRGQEAPEGSRYRQFFQDFEASTAFPNVRALEIVHRAMTDKPELAWKFLERREVGYAPPVQGGTVLAPVTMIELDLGERPPAVELIEGKVIDVTQEPTGPRSLPAGTSGSRPDPASGQAS